MKKTVEIISLIYRSNNFLKFISDQMKSDLCQTKLPDWEVGCRIIGNDPEPHVEKALPDCGVPYSIYRDHYHARHYIARVYSAYSFGGYTSNADYVIFVNSDDLFSKGWLDNLLLAYRDDLIPCSRLFEARGPSGAMGVTVGPDKFGNKPGNIDVDKWEAYAAENSIDLIIPRGLFMPALFKKSRFLESGCYPQGNICKSGLSVLGEDVICAGDDWYFRFLEKHYGMRHVTVMNSCVFHLVESEMRE